MALGLLSCRPQITSRITNGTRSAVPAGVRAPVPCALRCLGMHAQPVLRRRSGNSGSAPRTQRVVMTASAAAAPSFEPAQPAWGPVQLLARAAALAISVWRAAVAKFAAAAAGGKEFDAEAVNAQIKGSVRNMRTLMLVAPFAAISNSSVHTLLLITRAVSSFIKLYLLLLFMRVLLSWFPAFNWEDQPWLALRQVTDPYLNLFRGLVPPLLGTIDFTPLFGFMILQFLAGVLEIQDEDSDVW